MLEEKILAALEKMQADISGLKKGQDAMQSDISGIKVRLDTEIERKLNLLAEGQELRLEKLERLDDMEVMDTRTPLWRQMEKKLNRDIEKLKSGAVTPLPTNIGRLVVRVASAPT